MFCFGWWIIFICFVAFFIHISDIAQKRKAASKAAFDALISSSEDENDDDYDNLHFCSREELVEMVKTLRKKLEKAEQTFNFNKGKHVSK